MKASLPRRASRRAMLVSSWVLAMGCQDPSASTSVSAPAPAHADQQVLLMLDAYDPMYKVDREGRVLRLRLAGRDLPVLVMAEVGKLTELQAIDLFGANVTDDGLAELKDLHQLTSLGLGSTSITDGGLVHLEKLPSLRWLWLSKQNVSEEAVARLKVARPDMNVFVH